MIRELHCHNVELDCDATVTAESDDNVRRQAADRVQSVHGMTDEDASGSALIIRVREQIHDKA